MKKKEVVLSKEGKKYNFKGDNVYVKVTSPSTDNK